MSKFDRLETGLFLIWSYSFFAPAGVPLDRLRFLGRHRPHPQHPGTSRLGYRTLSSTCRMDH